MTRFDDHGRPLPFYSLNGITIYDGDCLDILPTIEPGSVDLVLTDPPYGINERTDRASKKRGTETRGLIRHPSRDWVAIAGDSEPFDPTHLLIYPRIVLFGANHFADRLPASRGWLVWDKRNGATTDDNADAELIWTNIPGVIRMYRQCWRGFAREGSESGQKHIHPTQKPVAIMEWLLDRYSKPGDLILDPYMGSGPVAAACRKMNRRYIGIEIVDEYVVAACKRLLQTAMNLEVA